MPAIGFSISEHGHELLQRIGATFDLHPGKVVDVLTQLAADILDDKIGKTPDEFKRGRPRESEEKNAKHLYCVLRFTLRKLNETK